MGRHTKRAQSQIREHDPIDVDQEETESHDAEQPLYARMLGLKHIAPGPLACFFLFEGVIGVSLLLALAGWVSWWGVAIIPVAVGGMVKLNDVVAGRAARARQAAAQQAADSKES